MDVKKIIHQGPGKTIYIEIGQNTLFPNRVFHFFTDEYFCEKTKETSVIPGKGALTNRLSALFFSQLKKWDVDTHFLWVRDMCTCAMKDITPLPFGLRMYCKADEFMAKHFSLEAGTSFSPLLIEYTNSQGSYGSYGLNEDFLVALDWIDQDDLEDLVALALRCVHGFRGFFGAKDLQLISMDLSFGRSLEGDFVLMGHFSPETLCLQWEKDNSFWGGRYLEQDPQGHYHWFTSMFIPQEETSYNNKDMEELDFLWPQKPTLRIVKNDLLEDVSLKNSTHDIAPENLIDKHNPIEVLSLDNGKKEDKIQNPLDGFENVIHLTDFLHKEEPEEEDLWF